MLQSIYNPDPSGFQTIMNAYEEANGWPVVKHPPLSPHFLAALSDQEPLLPNNLGSLLAGRLSRAENTPASDPRKRKPRSRSSSPISMPTSKSVRTNSPVSVTPSSDLGLPLPLDSRGSAAHEPVSPTFSEASPTFSEAVAAVHISGASSRRSASPQKATSAPDIMEVVPLPIPPAKSPEQSVKTLKAKQKSKDKTSPSTKISTKSIRDKLATTKTSPIEISVQHEQADENMDHPAPKKLLKNMQWKINTVSKGNFPTISMTELYQHIKCNRILYGPPNSINLTHDIIETLAYSHPSYTVHFKLEPRFTLIPTKEKIYHLPGSRATSPVRPKR